MATVLNNEVGDVNYPPTAFVLKWLFPLAHPYKVVKIICMDTSLVMKNWVMNLFTGIQGWSNFYKLWAFVRIGKANVYCQRY